MSPMGVEIYQVSSRYLAECIFVVGGRQLADERGWKPRVGEEYIYDLSFSRCLDMAQTNPVITNPYNRSLGNAKTSRIRNTIRP